MFRYIIAGVLLILASGYSAGRIGMVDVQVTEEVMPGRILINEVLAGGSRDRNEFGERSDWLELYNPAQEDLHLERGLWSITDKGPLATKAFELPAVTIAAGAYLVIWCDGLNTQAADIHTDFSLSSSGEHLAILYHGTDGLVVVDQVQFGEQAPGTSEGRDEHGEWAALPAPTPGRSNEIRQIQRHSF